jgi:hypothetical protein
MIWADARVFGTLGKPSALPPSPPPPINFQKLMLCISVNTNSAFIISDLVFQDKGDCDTEFILSLFCLYTQYVLKEIHTRI